MVFAVPGIHQKKSCLFSLLTVFCLLVVIPCLSQQKPLKWELRKDQDSIRIFVADNPGSSLKMVRAEFTLHARREELFHQLLRADLYREWQFNTIHSEVLEAIGPHELIYYCEVSAPWPVDNRDLIMRLKVNNDPTAREFTINTTCEPNARPRREGIVRVPSSRGDWRVRQVGPEMLKVEFQIQIDPGGAVPAWLVNLTLAQAPYQTFSNLKQRIANNRK